MRLQPSFAGGHFSKGLQRRHQLRLIHGQFSGRTLSMSAAPGGASGGSMWRKRGVRAAPDTSFLLTATVTNQEILREFASVAAAEVVGSMNGSSPSDLARVGERPEADGTPAAGLREENGKEMTATDEARPTGYK